MGDRLVSWRMVEAGAPLRLTEEPLPEPGQSEILLRVRACGLCHTDFGFLYGGVRTNASLPLTLGHEIVGDAVAAGSGEEDGVGKTFIVPAVLPCGECELCTGGRGNVCRSQKMPGNDFHGGFASHFLAPARHLCPVPDGFAEVEHLAVIADAVSTSYQAVLRAQVRKGDMLVVVGVGGLGTYAVQTGKSLGAYVAGVDIATERLEALADYVDLPLDATALDEKGIRRAVAAYEEDLGLPSYRRKILECSGTAAGQQTAYSLLTYNATLVVVGFTMDKVTLRLSNLMAFDARVLGNWGCLPEHFPEILRLIGRGKLEVDPFVKKHPMSTINDLLRREHHHRRPVLIPDFDGTPC